MLTKMYRFYLMRDCVHFNKDIVKNRNQQIYQQYVCYQ